MSKQTVEVTHADFSDHETHLDSVDFFSKVVEIEEEPDQKRARLRDELAAEMAQDIETCLPAMFEQLSKLYQERSIGQTFHWSSNIDEETTYATRTYDGSRLEEIYRIVDNYSLNNRNWRDRTYIVNFQPEDNGTEYRIDYNENTGSAVRVKDSSDSNAEWQRVFGEEAEQIAVNFFREAIRATVEQIERTDAQIDAANKDAFAKLVAHGKFELRETSFD